MQKLQQLYFTVIYLKPIQIRYQLFYRIRKLLRRLVGFHYQEYIQRCAFAIELTPWIDKPTSYKDGAFTFINITSSEPSFKKVYDSPLWGYNLNYMDYLLQPNISKEEGIALIEKFITEYSENPIATDPYPIALRTINWIKFFTKHPFNNEKFNAFLYAQYKILQDNIEYHLLGNHLLEDGFSLLFGGYYFNDEALYRKGKKIVESELKEQILDDGAHFELSPMYHQILLDRLLDCINLVSNNKVFDNQQELLLLMREKAIDMLNWLDIMTFKNGSIPLFNDSAVSIAPSSQELVKYAAKLGVIFRRNNPNKLSTSGYRKFSSQLYECVIDIGSIAPSYQPGHAHADTFGFVMNVDNQPLFMDYGISTYNATSERIREKSTSNHNTVTVLDENSSQVWSSFRVGRRAKVDILKDTLTHVIAIHDGYRAYKTKHQREWKFTESEVFIKDNLVGKQNIGKAHFWLNVDDVPVVNNENIIVLRDAIINFVNASDVEIRCEKMPRGYNLMVDTYKIEVMFSG